MVEVVELPELDSFSKSLLYLSLVHNAADHLFLTIFDFGLICAHIL